MQITAVKPLLTRPSVSHTRAELEQSTPTESYTQESAPAHPRTELLPKVACAAVLGSAAWLACNLAGAVAGAPTVGAALGTGAACLAAAAAGHCAGDLFSGIFHHYIDNYPNPDTPVIGPTAYAFQVHHHKIHDLEQESVWTNMASAGRFLWIPMAAAAALHAHPLVAAAMLGFNGGGFLAQASHRWTHEKNPPAIARVLQKLGVVQSKASHAIHHKMPWADNYCIVNGMWNPLLTRTAFFRKWEKLIYDVTGKEPHCWKDPGVKAFALGQISHDEFLAGQGMNRRIFADAVRGEFAEYEKRMGLK